MNAKEIKNLNIGLIQKKHSAGTTSALAESTEAIRKAAQKGANIVCLQELFNSKYFCTSENQENFALAETLAGASVTSLAKLAAELEIAIIAPFFERRAAGIYHNSAAVIDADGSVLGTYRKMHIPDDPLYYEKFYFTPGDAEQGFPVFDTRFGRISVLICWDQWFPEAARLASLAGAEVLFYPTAIGWHPEEKLQFGEKQRQAWITAQRAHAIANGVFVAAVNRTGKEETAGTKGIEFFGSSFICDPFGEILSQAPTDSEAVLVEECSTAALEETRQNWPFFRDRRVDAYSDLSRRFID